MHRHIEAVLSKVSMMLYRSYCALGLAQEVSDYEDRTLSQCIDIVITEVQLCVAQVLFHRCDFTLIHDFTQELPPSPTFEPSLEAFMPSTLTQVHSNLSVLCAQFAASTDATHSRLMSSP